MITVQEYQLEITPTPDRIEEVRARQAAGEPLECPIQMPRGALVRRVNTRILPVERTGINPQTKEIGRFTTGEECVYLWAEVDEAQPLEQRTFLVIPTKFKVPPKCNYVGTFLLQMGMHALHVYEPTALGLPENGY